MSRSVSTIVIILQFSLFGLVEPLSRVDAGKNISRFLDKVKEDKPSFRPLILIYQQEYEEMAGTITNEAVHKLKIDFSTYKINTVRYKTMKSMLRFGMTLRTGGIISLLDRNTADSWFKMLQLPRYRPLCLNVVIYTEDKSRQQHYTQLCSPERRIYVVYNNMSDPKTDINILHTHGIYAEQVDNKRQKCYSTIFADGPSKYLNSKGKKDNGVHDHLYVGHKKNNPYFKISWVNNTKIIGNRGEEDDDDSDWAEDRTRIDGTKLLVEGFEAHLIDALLRNFTTHSPLFETPRYKRCSSRLNISCQSTLPESVGPARSLIDMLLNQKIDLAISRIPLTVDIIQMMDHSPVYSMERFVIISRTRNIIDSDNLIFKPVEPTFWYWMILVMLVMAPPYVLMDRYVKGDKQRLSAFGFVSKMFAGLFYTYRLFFGFVKAEGHPHLSLRLYSFVWGISGLFFCICYSSMFTAAMSFNSIQTNIDTLAQLKRDLLNEKITLALTKTENVVLGPIKDESDNSVYSEIYTIASQNNRMKQLRLEEMVDYMASNPQAVLITDVSSSYAMANALQNRTNARYHISNDQFGWEMYTIVRRKGFPDREKWDKYLWNILSSGMLDYWYQYDRFYHEYQYKTSLERSKENTSLRVTHFTALWYFYAVGMGSAISAFILEIVISKMMMKPKRRPSLASNGFTKHRIRHIRVPALVFQ